MITITDAELQLFFWLQGIQPHKKFVGDEKYVLPDREWFYGDFARSVQTTMIVLGISKWLAEKNDCDNGSRFTATWAGICNARTRTSPAAELAVGQFWYKPIWGKGLGHATTVAVVPGKGKPLMPDLPPLDLCFWEWTNFSPLTITPEERATCYAYLF